MKKNSSGGLLSSSSWGMLAGLTDKVAVLIVYIILARFISKEDFGYIALCLLIIDYATYLSGMGVREKLITSKDWSQKMADNGFWLLVTLSILMSILIFFGVSPLLSYTQQNSSVLVIQAISLIPLINSVNMVQLAKLQREFKFKTLAIRSIIATSISTSISVYMAFHQYGIWSFIAYKYSYAICNTIILWSITKYRPSFRLDIEIIKSYIVFGLPIIGTGIIHLSNRKLMETIITPTLGIKKLGELDIGKKIPETLYQVALAPLNAVSLTYFSKSPNKHKAFCDYITTLSIFITPIILSLGFFSSEIVFVIFGKDKVPVSSEILTIVSFGVFYSLYGWFIQSYLISIAKQKANFYITLCELIFVLSGSILFINKGITEFVTAYIILASTFTAFKFVYFKIYFGFDLKYFIRNEVMVWLSATALILTNHFIEKIGLFSSPQTEMTTLAAITKTVTLGTTGIAAYAAILLIFFRKKILTLLIDLKNYRH